MPEDNNQQNTVENKDATPNVDNVNPNTTTGTELPANNGEKIVERNEDGTLKKGSVLNPDGKPRGAKHMTTLLREAIVKVAEGDATPADEQIVKRVIELAKLGNLEAIKHVWNYLDGKAPETINLAGEVITGLTDEQKAKLDFILGIKPKEQEVVEPAVAPVPTDDKQGSTPESN